MCDEVKAVSSGVPLPGSKFYLCVFLVMQALASYLSSFSPLSLCINDKNDSTHQIGLL